MRRALRALTAFWLKADKDGITGLSAMVAYNLLLSIFPLALLAIYVAGRVLESEELVQTVADNLRQVFPSAAESTLLDALRRLRETSATTGIVALVTALYLGGSFWGALDTAFCRIYGSPCRPWVRQKIFAVGMLIVVLLFLGASIFIPTVQALLVQGAEDLPFGLDEVRGLVGALTLAGGLVVLFGLLCLIYWRVPSGKVTWTCIWPGALGVTVAVTVINWGFPLYLANVSTLRPGTTLVFVLIVLVWFYALALVLLAGAVVNALRFAAAGKVRTPELRGTVAAERATREEGPEALVAAPSASGERS